MGNSSGGGGGGGAAAKDKQSPVQPPLAHASSAAEATAASDTRRADLERRLRYEALGESEAGAARQDPFPPSVFPASRPPPTGKREKTTHASSSGGGGAEAAGAGAGAAAAAASSSSAAATALPARSDFRARISDSVPSQLAAINQNLLKENPTVTEELHKQVHFGHEMLAGSVASVISRFCVAPLDVLKIRFQIQEQASHHRQYTSIAQAFKSIYHKEGIMAFWKGNAAAELMVVPYGAVSFLSYSTCKSWFPVEHTQSQFASYQHLSSLVAGSAAGFCATISTYPLDLLRTRFAAQQQHKVYSSLMHAARHIVEREGIGGLYTGMCPTLIGIVPLMALQFGSYEAFKQAIRNAKAPADVDPNSLQLTFMEQSCAGFSAGVISKFLTMPLDVIKKRFQVSGFEIPCTPPNGLSHPPDTHEPKHAKHHAPVAATATAAVTGVPPTVPVAALPPSGPAVLSHQPPGQPIVNPASVSGTFAASTPLGTALKAQATTALTSAHGSSLTPPAVPAVHNPVLPPPSIHSVSAAATSSPSASTAPPSSAVPLITRRRRRHDQPVAGRRPFTGVWDCARGILAHEGLAGLFKGSIPSILKAGPNSAIIYMVYEYTIRFLNEGLDDTHGNHSAPKDEHKFKQ